MCRYVDIVSVCIHMHTELLLNLGSCSVVTGFKGFSSLFVCFTFIFCHIDISSLYRGVISGCLFGLLDCVRYMEILTYNLL